MTVVDAMSKRDLVRVPVGQRPHHVAISPDGRRAYVANSESNDITIIDAMDKKVIGRVLVGRGPHGIAAK